jgi:hypothetical protein
MTYIRQNSDIIKGGKLMVFVGDEPIAFSTNHTLSLTRNTQEVSSKDHGDANAVLPTTQSWEITSENLMSTEGYSTILAAYLNGTPVTVYFGASTYNNSQENGIVGVGDAANWAKEAWTDGAQTPNSLNLTGTAYITSLSVNAPSGDNATYSVTFTGSGSITRATVS